MRSVKLVTVVGFKWTNVAILWDGLKNNGTDITCYLKLKLKVDIFLKIFLHHYGQEELDDLIELHHDVVES